MKYTCKIPSPVGVLTIASDGECVNGLWIEGQKYDLETLGKATLKDDLPVFNNVRLWLEQYFQGREPDVLLKLVPEGTPFRKKVWEFLCEIPFGKTVTYGQIAAELGIKSAQAVGGAVGHNPISIIIPCHRVVGADGSLTGYAGGIQTKVKLLETEHVSMENFYVPTRGTAL